MAEDWRCHVCGTAVSWGTVVCPLCGSALDWEEADEEEPPDVLGPPGSDGGIAEYRARRARRYAIGMIVVGLLLAVVGAISGFTLWYLLALGALLAVAGVYGLMAHPAER